MTGPLTGKLAVITGASRGIGRATAGELAALGAHVIVTARTAVPRDDIPGTITETAKAIETAGGRASAVKADLLVPAECGRLVNAALAASGSVDILVNNAAYIGEAVFESFWEMSLADWRAAMELNVNALFALTKAFTPQMRAQGTGVIVNVSSLAGAPVPPGAQLPLPGKGGLGAAYPTSKAAVTQMTAYLGNELREAGIALIGLDPGFARSESAERFSSLMGSDLADAQPVEVAAKAIGWLATCDDPLAYAGQLVVAREIVDEHQLLDL